MGVVEIVEALTKAADAMAELHGPDEEAHLIDNAFDGIASALGYLKTWRERVAPEDIIFKEPPPKRFKLLPLKPRKVVRSQDVLNGVHRAMVAVQGVSKLPGGLRRQSRVSDDTVICSVEVTTAINDDDREQTCTVVTCGECAHKTQSWGDGPRSVRRCLALLREECLEERENFYKTDDGSENE